MNSLWAARLLDAGGVAGSVAVLGGRQL